MPMPHGPNLVEALVEYISQPCVVEGGQLLQVYEELTDVALWTAGFAPRNVLEIGTVGATFFLLSRLATGKKAAVDLKDARLRLHYGMLGHDWRFFQGDSQTPEMRQRVSEYCDFFDLIFIDGDHSYEGVKRDFANYRTLLSDRGVILFHDVDPDHEFKGAAGGGDVWRFWAELDEGYKTTLVCNRSSGRIVHSSGKTSHFGGFGIWRPERS